MSIGSRIYAFRRAKGIKQADLAHEIGISHGALVNYEKGPREPPVAAVVAICKKHNISPDWLLFGHGTMERPDIDQNLDVALRTTKSFLPKYRKSWDIETEIGLVKMLFKYLATHGELDEGIRDSLFQAMAANE